jgi:hypothetical protein
MKLCKDCRYLTGGIAIVSCNHPSNGTDPLTGNAEWDHAPTMRKGGGRCGPAGKLFTPYPPRRTFVQWLCGNRAA